MNNAILMIAYNNLELTKAAVLSALNQDIPVDLFIVNNGSTDGSREWLDSLAIDQPNVTAIHYDSNSSPCAISNSELEQLFVHDGYSTVLGMANDILLPPNAYREMLKWPRGIVCASEIHDRATFDAYHPDSITAVSENTPMSLMMLRKWAWEALIAKDGYFFDESFFMYASDCDLALRLASCGIHGLQLNLGYFHVSSATIKNAGSEARLMHMQADCDRATFERKWGFRVDALEYGQRASDINFKGEGK